MELKGRRYDNSEPVCIQVEGGRIASVTPITPEEDVSQWPYIAPGLFDLQINGFGGVWFSKLGLTADEVIQTLEPHFKFGITRMCPTLITNSHEALLSGFSALRGACEREEWVDAMVPGFHLEGPFISKEDGPRGAHPLKQVRPADWEEFRVLQEAAGGRICLVTLAAESEGAVEFIKHAVEADITISIGHTAAEPEQIAAAVDAGATLSTHLGNGAHGQIRRHPNYIWEQLGDSRLYASIISDGHHLPASVVRSFIQTKSTMRTIITCDASGLAGCPPGVYTLDSGNVEVLEDGNIVIAGQRQLLAGSGSATHSCVANAIEMAGVSLQQAFDMAGQNPSHLLGFEVVRLQRGSRADLVLFHYDGPGSKLDVVRTVSAGVERFNAV